MTDQTTPEALTDDELAEIRRHERAYVPDSEDAPILAETAADRRDLLAEVDRLRTEARRLHTWDGLMSLLDEHWPEAILPTLPDEPARDAGSRIVSLIRWIEMLHSETRRLGVSLAETIQERQQLRTRLADAEQTRRAALAVVADLTEDLAEARAETDRQRHEREKYTERWDALDQAAGALHGWTIYPTTDGGLMVSHDTDADRPTLASDDSIPLAAVLAFIASHTDDDTTE